jgi:hypothetical protein
MADIGDIPKLKTILSYYQVIDFFNSPDLSHRPNCKTAIGLCDPTSRYHEVAVSEDLRQTVEVNLVGNYAVSHELDADLLFFNSIHFYSRNASDPFDSALKATVEHII